MPWKETAPLFERTVFVAAYEAEEDSLSALCRRFGVSRKTAYKWIHRVREEGDAGLEDRSRAPHTHPNALPPDLEQAILDSRGDRAWGPKKVLACLARTWTGPLPSLGSVAHVLGRHGLVTPRHRVRHATPSSTPLADVQACNVTWGIDFKGWFRTGDGTRVDPLTVTDAHTRYLLCCQAVAQPDGPHVRTRLETVFRTYGLPERLRSDNGPPFAGTGLAGLSQLGVWWLQLGIVPERIRPGHPEENGRHERFHLTLAQATATPPAGTLGAQQRRFDTFRREYNEERPHEALGQVTPASLYTPSARPYPARLAEATYPDDWATRRVRPTGQMKWRGHLVYLSQALAGHAVGLEPVSDGVWRVHVFALALGMFDERRHTVESLEAYAKRAAKRAARRHEGR